MSAQAWKACMVACAMAASIAAGAQQAAPEPEPGAGLDAESQAIGASRLLDHVTILASDRFEGRAPATQGEALTIDYLVRELRNSGTEPGNPDGTYVQEVPLVGFLSRPELALTIRGRRYPLQPGKDFVHEYVRMATQATARDAGVVFAGYGIEAPEYAWNDYKDVDVRGKLVILLRGEPSRPDPADASHADPAFFRGDKRTYYATGDYKNELARRKGAAAVLIVVDPAQTHLFSLYRTFAGQEGFRLREDAARPSLLMTGLLEIGAARRVLAAAGSELSKLEAAAGRADFAPVAIDAGADIALATTLRDVTSRNVVARLTGSDPVLKDEFIVYTAHWDHLGRDPRLRGDQIYNGAIDDGIGVAQMLEIARAFAGAHRPRRTMLFIATTCEEKGFFGARHYVRHPFAPIDAHVAEINLDGGNAWGRTSDVMSSGHGLSDMDEALARAASMQGRTFADASIDDDGLYFGSDNMEFAKAGVPAVFPFSGFVYPGRAADFGERKWGEYADRDYHQVSDEVRADWDLSGAAEDARWLFLAGRLLADAPQRPQWRAQAEFAGGRFARPE
jgi:Zn-dependent M28 family amino/carboxypeptidase